MIYILVGDDLKKKNIYFKKLVSDNEPVFLSSSNVTKELINNYASSVSLFAGVSIIVIEDLIKQKEIIFSKEELEKLKRSQTVFVLLEDKLLVADEKEYKKYSTIETFKQKEIKEKNYNKDFELANAFAQKDKIKTWILYREAIEKGIEPEAISGMLFWKIKNLILNGNRVFPLDILKKQSSEIVSLYHKAHRGETDFVVGLEQFILSSLSK